MGKSSPSAPAAPSPTETAQAQAAANKEAVREQALVNQINQETPYGSLTYSGDVGSSNRTATVSLSPEQQRILDLQNQAGEQYGELANQQLGAVSDTLAQPLDYSTLGATPQANEETRQQVYQSILDRNQPRSQQQYDMLQTRLANQGVTDPNSQAYRDAIDEYYRGQNDFGLAAQQAALGQQSQLYNMELAGRNQAINEMLQQRQVPLNELAALTTGAQVQNPQFVSVPQQSVQPVDISGMTYGSANLANTQYQNQQSAQAANNQGLYSLLGTGALAAGMYFSDRRLKRDIKCLGEHKGLPVYMYRYIWGGPAYIGYMADEVKALYPHAVHNHGFDAVDYGAI